MDVFKDAWEREVRILTDAVDDITTIHDFLAVSGEIYILSQLHSSQDVPFFVFQNSNHSIMLVLNDAGYFNKKKRLGSLNMFKTIVAFRWNATDLGKNLFICFV